MLFHLRPLASLSETAIAPCPSSAAHSDSALQHKAENSPASPYASVRPFTKSAAPHPNSARARRWLCRARGRLQDLAPSRCSILDRVARAFTQRAQACPEKTMQAICSGIGSTDPREESRCWRGAGSFGFLVGQLLAQAESAPGRCVRRDGRGVRCVTDVETSSECCGNLSHSFRTRKW